MQINLKQHEIEQALKAYVSHQGISLFGKEINISFTAGRRESGISAEINIEDVEIPGDIEAFDSKPAEVVSINTAIEKQPEVVKQEETPVEAVTPEVKTTSLFS